MRKITIIFIVNGVDVPIDVDPGTPIKVARDAALSESNNTGRPYDEWEIHNDRGHRLDPENAVPEDGSRVFLNLKVGAGGAKLRQSGEKKAA